MGLVTSLLFKPRSVLFKPIRFVYLVGGAITVAGLMLSAWMGNFPLFGLFVFLAVVWSVIYSLFSP